MLLHYTVCTVFLLIFEGCFRIWMCQAFVAVHGCRSTGIRQHLMAVTGNTSISSRFRQTLRSFMAVNYEAFAKLEIILRCCRYFCIDITSNNKKPSCRQDSRPYCQKLQGSHDLGHAHFQGKFLCACLSFSIQSRVPNLKSLAQVVFEILRFKRIGVTSLTFQGHVTSSVT